MLKLVAPLNWHGLKLGWLGLLAGLLVAQSGALAANSASGAADGGLPAVGQSSPGSAPTKLSAGKRSAAEGVAGRQTAETGRTNAPDGQGAADVHGAWASGWGSGLMGVAGALGLVSMATLIGMGEGAAVWLLGLVLLALVAGLLAWVRGRSGGVDMAMRAAPDLAFSGGSPGAPPAATLHQARDYSPQNVGNDASARPWERQSMAFQASRFSDTQSEASAEPTPAGWGAPQGFDVPAFLEASKANFVALQAAWDRADIPSLRAMMTDEMLNQIRAQLSERERQSPGLANVTEVVMLEAHLLGVEEADTGHVASVEFSGLIREHVSAGPSPFREVWNITRPKVGSSGWLVAGVQALQ